jgi:hypothetical protein
MSQTAAQFRIQIASPKRLSAPILGIFNMISTLIVDIGTYISTISPLSVP